MSTEPNQLTPALGSAPPASPSGRRLVVWCLLSAIALLVAAAVTIPRDDPRKTNTCASCCVAILKQIDGATQQWALEHRKPGASRVTAADVLEFLKGSAMPTCPKGGTYVLGTVSEAPRCTQSAIGHSL